MAAFRLRGEEGPRAPVATTPLPPDTTEPEEQFTTGPQHRVQRGLLQAESRELGRSLHLTGGDLGGESRAVEKRGLGRGPRRAEEDEVGGKTRGCGERPETAPTELGAAPA